MPRAKKQNASGNGKLSKAELIRQTAKKIGRTVRPKDIIGTLKEQGIAVTSAQVSTTLRAAGFRRRRRRKMANGAPRETVPTTINLDALVAAKALIGKVGGIEAAEEALKAMKRLQ